MGTKTLNFKLESNNKTLEIGKGKSYRLLNIEGIESGELELFTTDNVLADGSMINDRRIKARYITIEAEYVKFDKEDERRRLINFFNIHKDGTLFIIYSNVRLKIEYVVEQFRSKINNVNEPLKFLVDLFSPCPFWQGLKEEITDLVTWIPQLEFLEDGFYTEQTENKWIETSATSEGFEEFISEFGIGEGVEFGYREVNQIVEIDNNGDVETPLRVIFRASGEVVRPYIQDMQTYEILRINKTLKAGDVLEITTGYNNKNIYLNGEKAHHYLDFLNSSWLQLKPGTNLMKYGAESGLVTLECRIIHTPQYLGV